MHVTCARRDLERALTVVAQATTTHSTLPTLRNVVLRTVGQNHLQVLASNLEFGLQWTLAATVEQQGWTTTPGRALLTWLHSQPASKQDERLTLHSIEQAASPPHSALIVQEQVAFFCSGHDTFPHIGHPEVLVKSIACTTQMLKRLVSQVASAADPFDADPLYANIWIQCREDEISFAAGSASRCALHALPLKNATPDLFLIKASVLKKLVSLLPRRGNVSLQVDRHKSVLCLHTDTVSCVTRIVESSPYPQMTRNAIWQKAMRGESRPFESYLPKRLPTQITVERKALSTVFARRDIPVSCEVIEGDEQAYFLLRVYYPDRIETTTIPVMLKGASCQLRWLNMRSLAQAITCPGISQWLTLSFGPTHADSVVLRWVESSGKEYSSYAYAFAPLNPVQALQHPSVRRPLSRQSQHMVARWRESWQAQEGANEGLTRLGEETVTLLTTMLEYGVLPTESERELNTQHVQSLAGRATGMTLVNLCLQHEAELARALAVAAFADEGGHLSTMWGAFHFYATDIRAALAEKNSPLQKSLTTATQART